MLSASPSTNHTSRDSSSVDREESFGVFLSGNNSGLHHRRNANNMNNNNNNNTSAVEQQQQIDGSLSPNRGRRASTTSTAPPASPNTQRNRGSFTPLESNLGFLPSALQRAGIGAVTTRMMLVENNSNDNSNNHNDDDDDNRSNKANNSEANVPRDTSFTVDSLQQTRRASGGQDHFSSPSLFSVFSSPATVSLSATNTQQTTHLANHQHHSHHDHRPPLSPGSNPEHSLSATNLRKLEEESERRRKKKSSFLGIATGYVDGDDDDDDDDYYEDDFEHKLSVAGDRKGKNFRGNNNNNTSAIDGDADGVTNSNSHGSAAADRAHSAPFFFEPWCVRCCCPTFLIKFVQRNRAFLRLAVPSMAIQFLRNFISALAFAFAGRLLDKRHLGGFILGFSYTNAIGIAIGMGISSVLDTLCTQAFGFYGSKTTVIGMHLRTALVVAFGYSVLYLLSCVLVGQHVVRLLKPELVDSANAFLLPSVVQVFGTTCVSATHKFLNAQHKTHLALKGYIVGSICAFAMSIAVVEIRDRTQFFGGGEKGDAQGQLRLVTTLCLVIGVGRLISGFCMFALAMRDPDVYFCWSGLEKIAPATSVQQAQHERSGATGADDKNGPVDADPEFQLDPTSPMAKFDEPPMVESDGEDSGHDDDDTALRPIQANDRDNKNNTAHAPNSSKIVAHQQQQEQQQKQQEDLHLHHQKALKHLWREAVRWSNVANFVSHCGHSIVSSCADRWTFEVMSAFIATKQYSEVELDAFGTLTTIWIFSFPPSVGCYVGASTLVGNALGAGKGGRAQFMAWKAVSWAFTTTVVLSLLYGFFPRIFIRLFVTHDEIVDAIAQVAPIYAVGFVGDAMQFVFQGVFRAMGRVAFVSKASAIVQWGIAIPLAAVLVLHYSHGLVGLGISLLVGNFIQSFAYFFSLQDVQWNVLAYTIKQNNERIHGGAASPVPTVLSPQSPSPKFSNATNTNASAENRNNNDELTLSPRLVRSSSSSPSSSLVVSPSSAASVQRRRHRQLQISVVDPQTCQPTGTSLAINSTNSNHRIHDDDDNNSLINHNNNNNDDNNQNQNNQVGAEVNATRNVGNVGALATSRMISAHSSPTLPSAVAAMTQSNNSNRSADGFINFVALRIDGADGGGDGCRTDNDNNSNKVNNNNNSNNNNRGLHSSSTNTSKENSSLTASGAFFGSSTVPTNAVSDDNNNHNNNQNVNGPQRLQSRGPPAGSVISARPGNQLVVAEYSSSDTAKLFAEIDQYEKERSMLVERSRGDQVIFPQNRASTTTSKPPLNQQE